MTHSFVYPIRIDMEDVDFHEGAANDDEEVVELEVEYIDAAGRVLWCCVGWNGVSHEADWVDVWDENGNRVEVDFGVREAIVQKALA